MMNLAIDLSRRRLAIALAGACALLLCAATFAGSARAVVPDQADTAFNTNAAAAGLGGLTNTVFSVAADLPVIQGTGGKVLVGGAFPNGLKRFNADGTLDSAFNSNVAASLNGEVYSVAVDRNGKILVGGAFTGFLKRFNADGTLDSDFNTHVDAMALDRSVYSVAVAADGTVLAGGDFTGHLRRFYADGWPDSLFDWTVDRSSSLDDTVISVLVDGNGKIVVGGYFVSGLKRFNTDGEVDAPFNTNAAAAGLGGRVLSLALDPREGHILVGGSFPGAMVLVGPNGTSDSSINQDQGVGSLLGSTGNVFSVALTTGGVGAAGGTLAGRLKWFQFGKNPSGSFSLGGGNFSQTPDNYVRSLAYDGGGNLLAGGAFSGGLMRFTVAPTPVTPAPVTPAPVAAPTPKPETNWLSPDKSGVVSAMITPQPGVTYTADASSKLAGDSAVGKVGKKLIKGSCKNIKIKQGKKKVARVSCRIKLTKGKWLVSIRPKKNGVFGIVNSKIYTIKK